MRMESTLPLRMRFAKVSSLPSAAVFDWYKTLPSAISDDQQDSTGDKLSSASAEFPTIALAITETSTQFSLCEPHPPFERANPIRPQTGASLGTLSLPTFTEFLPPVCSVRTILLRIRATGRIPSRPDWDLPGRSYRQPADFCFGEDTACISLVRRGKLFFKVRGLRLSHYFDKLPEQPTVTQVSNRLSLSHSQPLILSRCSRHTPRQPLSRLTPVHQTFILP